MSNIQKLEQEIQSAKELIARRALALKLAEVPEFRKLILDDFMRDEVVRNTNISGDPNLGEKERADAIAMAQAGGHLKRFLSAIVQMGNTAEKGLHEAEELLEELRQNGEDDGE